MEYPEVVRRLGKKIDISYYLKTVVGLCAWFINYDDRHQPSSEIVLEALKKLKDGKKAGDNKADDDRMDEDDLDELGYAWKAEKPKRRNGRTSI